MYKSISPGFSTCVTASLPGIFSGRQTGIPPFSLEVLTFYNRDNLFPAPRERVSPTQRSGAGTGEDELYAGFGDGFVLGGGEGHGYLILCGGGEKGRGAMRGGCGGWRVSE